MGSIIFRGLISSTVHEARVEESNRLILFRLLPGKQAAGISVFIAWRPLESSRTRGSKRQRECFGSTRVTAATSSNIENTLDSRPTGPRKTHFVSTTMAGDDYTVALKTTLASARGETAASSPDR